MKQLAHFTQQMHYHPEQVQDFTPTPMTLSTTMFYTGLNPYTMEPVFVARTKEEKQKQNSYFFWWKAPDAPQRPAPQRPAANNRKQDKPIQERSAPTGNHKPTNHRPNNRKGK